MILLCFLKFNKYLNEKRFIKAQQLSDSNRLS